MTCRLDHIAVLAPTLAAGNAWVRTCLGIEPPAGGAHPQMGTHNHLLRLGDDFFLEVIAADPQALKPGHSRWFGLDQTAATEAHWAEGRRLRGMVARTDDLPAVVSAAPDLLGKPTRITRGERAWQFAVRADGHLPMGGALPHVMDWGAQGMAAPKMPDHGCKLLALVLETPFPAAVTTLYGLIGLTGAPEVRVGPVNKLTAVIATPRGVFVLT